MSYPFHLDIMKKELKGRSISFSLSNRKDLGGLFSAPSSPADETPDNPGERKKKKKKRHLKL